MTSSLLPAPHVVLPLGCDRPRILTAPAAASSAGDEIADFVALHGLVLDPWQRFVLQVAMGERADGKFAAGEVGLIVPRQNGKGSIIEARELAGLFLLDEELITHTAHQFKTASDAFRRIKMLVDGSPELSALVKRMPNGPSEKGIELRNGNRLMFVARSGSSGRGFSGDVVILDEAYDLTQDEMDALVPTLTTKQNPQVWYTSSAGMAHSTVLADVRARGIAGSPTLAYMEWSVAEPGPDDPPLDPYDPAMLAVANPALGCRISPDYLEIERNALSESGLLRERLGIWDPLVGAGVFAAGVWDALSDAKSEIVGPVTFALAVADDRSWASIGAAGAGRSRGHVEIVASRRNTGWVVARMVELCARHVSAAVIVRPGSPAGALIQDLEDAGVRVVRAATMEYAQACGMFYDAVIGAEVRHLSQGELDTAVACARKKASADAWVWDARRSNVDISPLESLTLAWWGHKVHGFAGIAESVW